MEPDSETPFRRCPNVLRVYWIILGLLTSCSLMKVLLDGELPSANELTWKQQELDFNNTLTMYLDKAAERETIILYWHPEDDQTRVHNDTKLTWWCGSCSVTSNTTKMHEAAAIVFLHRYVTPSVMPPISSRKSNQLYVWLTGESPANILSAPLLNFDYMDSVQFNATMTYRRDSDIFLPYGGPGTPVENISAVIASKKRLAVAIVSNCKGTPGARFRGTYLSYLSSRMQLDTFGKCFMPFSVSRFSKNFTDFFNVVHQYKFFFAFENSYHCRDYITEKFHRNGFRSRTVPVVWGAHRKDYEAVAHPKSFIHVDDFKTADDLIEYLNYLDKNDTAYGEYFKHPRLDLPSHDGSKFQERAKGVCQLCRIANGINTDDVFNSNNNKTNQRPLFTDTISKRTVPSLKRWLLDDDEGCFNELKMNWKGKAVIMKAET